MKRSSRLAVIFIPIYLLFYHQAWGHSPVSFTASQASIATHPSGDAILWYLSPGTSVATLQKIVVDGSEADLQPDTRVDIPNVKTLCSVSISTGGAIYVAWHESDQFVVASFRPNGKKYWEDRIPVGPEPIGQCQASASLGDSLLIFSQRFIYTRENGEHKGSVMPVNQLRVGNSRPYITATGGYFFLNGSSSDSMNYDLCVKTPEYSFQGCKKDQVASELFTNPFPVLIKKDEFGADYTLALIGNNTVRTYLIGLNPGRTEDTMDAQYQDYTHSHSLLHMGDMVQGYGQQNYYDLYTLARLISILKSSPSPVSAIDLINANNDFPHNSRETLYSSENFGILPRSISSARLASVPDDCHQVDSQHQTSYLFATDGEVNHVTVYENGTIAKAGSARIGNWTIKAEQTYSVLAGSNFSNLAVLASEGDQWQVSTLDIGQFGLSANHASFRDNLGTNDLSDGIEILLDGLIDLDNPGRWALVTPDPRNKNTVISMINDAALPASQLCNNILNEENVNDPMSIGITPAPGSTAIGASRKGLERCLVGGDNFILYLMQFNDSAGEWQFTGNYIHLIQNTMGYSEPRYWLPEQCSLVNTALSSPVSNYKRFNDQKGGNLDVMGWPHIVFNASQLPETTAPVNFTAPSTPSPLPPGQSPIVGKVIAGTAATASAFLLVGAAILAGQVYKWKTRRSYLSID